MLKVYKIPGSFINCFVGPFGVGKSLGMLEQAALMAEYLDLRIVSNFWINKPAFQRYCNYKKFNRCSSDRIILLPFEFIDSDGHSDYYDEFEFSMFFSYSHAIYLLDEASLFFFSRNFKSVNMDDFKNLFQLRKRRSFLFFTCQDIDQIDKQLRDNIQTYIVCKGFQSFSRVHKSSRLYSRTMLAFSKSAFEQYNVDPILQSMFIRPLLLCGLRFSTSRLWLSRFILSLFLTFKFLCANFFRAIIISIKRLNPFWFFHYLNKWWDVYYNSDLGGCLIEEDYLFACFDSFGIVGDNSSVSEVSSPESV